MTNLAAAFRNFGNATDTVRVCRRREKNTFNWLIGREVMEWIKLSVVPFLAFVLTHENATYILTL
jgi:hypothetical protein